MLLTNSKTCAAILAAYVATAAGAPTTVKRGSFTVSIAESSINDCGDSTFVEESSTGAPFIADCQHLASNIAGGGTWTVDVGFQRTVATYGTCAFGVEIEYGTGTIVYVGNQDIIDLINSSIELFGWRDQVGAKGQMKCQGYGAAANYGGLTADWGLYHT